MENTSSNPRISGSTFRRILIPAVITVFTAILYLQDVSANTIAQGDHGRDMYVAWNVIRGEMPYRDFPYRYGPLGPYAVAPFLLVFGVTLQAAFISWYIFTLVGTFRLSQFLCGISSWCIGLLAVLPFVLTYRNVHHSFVTAPALVCLVEALIAAYLLLGKEQTRGHWLRLGIWCALLTGFKPNIGISFTAAVAAGIFLLAIVTRREGDGLKPSRTNIIFSVSGFFGLLVLLALIFIAGAPADFLAKSFPYSRAQQVVYGNPLMIMLEPVARFFSGEYVLSWTAFADIWRERIFWWLASVICGLILVVLAARRGAWPAEHRIALLFLLPAIAVSHEFIMNGSTYAINYWGMATGCILLAVAFSAAAKRRAIRVAKGGRKGPGYYVYGPAVVWLSFLCVWTNVENAIRFRTQKGQPLSGPGAKISVYDPAWAVVVNTGVEFLLKNTGPGEQIFCATYDPVYCTLSHRRQAGTYLHSKRLSGLTEENERVIICALEENDVRCVIVSNVAFNSRAYETWNGIFGRTHARLLWKHITANYILISTIGPWDKHPQWIKNHAIRIYWTNTERGRHPEIKKDIRQIFTSQLEKAYRRDAGDKTLK